jgi:hypothetical protein
MLDNLDALPNRELRDLVRQSYEMVAAKAPKSMRAANRGKATKKRSHQAKPGNAKARRTKR